MFKIGDKVKLICEYLDFNFVEEGIVIKNNTRGTIIDKLGIMTFKVKFHGNPTAIRVYPEDLELVET